MQIIASSNKLELLMKFKNMIFHKKETQHKTNTQKFNWYKRKISQFWYLQR